VIPENKVTRTVPAAGHAVTSGEPITIYESKGPPYVNVPSLANHSLHAAKKALRKLDLHYTTVEQNSDQVEEGNVIDVSPSRAQKFDQVTITVSKGPALVTVPMFRTLEDMTEVESQLAALNLNINIQRPFGGRGTHFLSCPQSGQQVPPGTTINVNAI
jgi:serine/threonine-protein kinase